LKLYNELKIKNCNLLLDSTILGRAINVDTLSEYTIDNAIFDRILLINKFKFNKIADDHERMLSLLNIQDDNEYIADILGRQNVAKKIQEFKTLSEASITDYYFTVLKNRYELTSKIHESVYDHSSSVTGRMTIKGGINYLTMKKDMRHNIKRSEGNHLVEIDVKSCEPALLHSILYNEMPEDIYTLFAENNIPRAKMKIAIISSLYGSSPSRVSKLSGLRKDTITKIHEHFKIKDHISMFKAEYEKSGYFLNMYGRPICEIASPMNYWLQSTAADFCCLAFKDLIKTTGFKLKAIIHDAIIVEVNDKQYQELSKIKKITDPLSKIALRVDNTLLT